MAKDGQGRTVFVVAADFKGLYYLKNVTIEHEDRTDVRGHRKFPSQTNSSSGCKLESDNNLWEIMPVICGTTIGKLRE